MVKLSIEITADLFEADPLFGGACEAYQLQIPLGGMPAINELQRALVSADTEAFDVLPRTSLHVTVLPLIDVKDKFDRPKREYWHAHSDKWREAISRACSMTAPLHLQFDT